MTDSLEKCRKIAIRQFYNNELEKTRRYWEQYHDTPFIIVFLI